MFEDERPQPPKAAVTPEEVAALKELHETIDETEFYDRVSYAGLIGDVQRRIRDRDQVLADAKAILVTTADPNFKPQGWLLPVGDAVRQTLEERKRLLAYRSELIASAGAAGEEIDLGALLGDPPRGSIAPVLDDIDAALAES